MKEQTASEVRLEREMVVQAYLRLAARPEAQAETIARHYVGHANAALAILKLIGASKFSSAPADVDELIARAIEDIKRNHRRDLGIELTWPLHRHPFL